MRISGIHMNGFGALQQVEIQFNQPVTVIYGNNEAGKSTVLGFIRAMLHGIPSRANMPDRYEPVHGGIHGGRLTAVDANGQEWVIERFDRSVPGSSHNHDSKQQKTQIRVTDAQGQVRFCSQAEMERELLGGLSADWFRRLFAVSLTELQEIRTLQSEEMSGFLFHAGLGGGRDIINAERKLTQEMDKLFRPKGRTQEINRVLPRLDHLDKEIRKSRAQLQDYYDRLSELEALELTLKAAEQSLSTARDDQAMLIKAQSMREAWLSRKVALQELETLPEWAEFPEDAVPRLQAMTAQLEELALRQQQTMRSIDELDHEMELLAADEAQIERLPEVDRLLGMIGTIESRKLERQELRTEREMTEHQLSHLLRQIDPGWTSAHLRAFPVSVQHRERVRLEKERCASSDRHIEGLNAERQQLERQMENAADDAAGRKLRLERCVEDGAKRFNHLVPTTKEEGQRIWSLLQHEVERWHAEVRGKSDEHRQEEAQRLAQEQIARQMRSLRMKLLAVSGGLTVILPVLCMIAKQWWLGGVFLLILLLTDIYLYTGIKKTEANSRGRRRRPNPDVSAGESVSPRLQEISKLLGRLISHPLSAVGRAGIDQDGGTLSIENAAEAEAAIDTQIQELRIIMEAWFDWQREKETAAARYEEGATAVERLRRQHRDVCEDMDRHSALMDEQRLAWEAWLRTQELPETLSPEAVLEIYQWAEQGMVLLQHAEKFLSKEKVLEAQINEFYAAVSGVLGAEEQIPSDQLLVALKSYKLQIDRHVSNQKTILQKQAQHAELESEQQALQMRIEQVQVRFHQLFADTYAQDEEQLRRHAKQVERRLELRRSLRQIEVLWETMDLQHQEEIAALLQQWDADQLAQQLEQSREKIKAAEQNVKECQERRGRLLHEIDQRKQESEHEDKLQQSEEQNAELRQLTGRFAAFAVCAELLRRTRRIYEEEKQPLVLKRASVYFAEMTNQRYVRIVAPLGEKRMLVETPDGQLTDSSLLSRGTAEQLYLAMRLSLSDAFTTHPHLPLLMDDLFVNFDAGRLDSTLRVLNLLSERHQILLLTCHAHVVQGIVNQFPHAQIVKM